MSIITATAPEHGTVSYTLPPVLAAKLRELPYHEQHRITEQIQHMLQQLFGNLAPERVKQLEILISTARKAMPPEPERLVPRHP